MDTILIQLFNKTCAISFTQGWVCGTLPPRTIDVVLTILNRDISWLNLRFAFYFLYSHIVWVSSISLTILLSKILCRFPLCSSFLCLYYVSARTLLSNLPRRSRSSASSSFGSLYSSNTGSIIMSLWLALMEVNLLALWSATSLSYVLNPSTLTYLFLGHNNPILY